MTDPSEDLFLGEALVSRSAAAWRQSLAEQGPVATAAAARGAFAAALPLQGGGVFLAVDRFAQETLCWRRQGQNIAFAERADALGVTDIDNEAILDYLFFHMVPSPRTIFRGVQRLPAGHCALAQDGQIRIEPFAHPHFAPDARPRFDDLKAEFRQLLRQAVQTRLGQGTPACFLSGGTDSSTVAGHIKALAGEVHTYSIGFDAQGYDEMAYARMAAQHFGAKHHEYYVTPEDLVRSIAHVATAYDQPFGNSSALPSYYCALKAREDGVTRLLAGDGGDELFGGNSRYATQRLYGLYGRLPGLLRTAVIEPLLGIAGAQQVPLLRKGRNYVRDAKVPLPDRLGHYNLLNKLGLPQVLAPAFLAAMRPESIAQQQRDVWAMAQADNDLDRMLAYDWRYTLAESDLPKVRGTSRLAGMDVAYPFLDDALLAFSMRLPTHYKLRGFKLRWFFKEALRDFLPAAIITKQKKGFGLPFGVWATQHAGLKALASDSVRAFATRGVVRPEFAQQLLDDLLPAHPGYYGEMVWILMMLEQWLRGHAPDWRFEAGAAAARAE
ncbi:MAG: asparagine synthase C-terminal domain-containing protein [Rubrivivax sp.]|nr:asparagine synthase C-terminal domain-containing protein [Rubrivivax sp.]